MSRGGVQRYLGEALADPSRVTPAVNYRINEHWLLSDFVEHGKWESLGKQTMVVAGRASVDATEKSKRLNIGEEIGEEVSSEAALLIVLEVKAFNQVLNCLVEHLNVREDVRAAIRFLAASQLMNRALPCRTSPARSSSSSLCHCGTGIASSVRQRSSQRASIVRSFSFRLIRSSSSTTDMGLCYAIGGERQ